MVVTDAITCREQRANEEREREREREREKERKKEREREREREKEREVSCLIKDIQHLLQHRAKMMVDRLQQVCTAARDVDGEHSSLHEVLFQILLAAVSIVWNSRDWRD